MSPRFLVDGTKKPNQHNLTLITAGTSENHSSSKLYQIPETVLTINFFFSLKKKMQFKFFYLFIFKVFACFFQFLHKKKRQTLIRGVKGPKKSFNTFLIKSHYAVLSLFTPTGLTNLLMFTYLLNQNYFNFVKLFQLKKQVLPLYI